MLLQGGLCVLRRIVTPELVDQAVGRDDLARVQEQDREDAPLLRPSEADLPIAVSNLEWAEDAEVKAAGRQRANVPRPSARR